MKAAFGFRKLKSVGLSEPIYHAGEAVSPGVF